MRARPLLLLALLLAPSRAAAAPSLTVWLPRSDPALKGAAERAFRWAAKLEILDPAQVEQRFAESPGWHQACEREAAAEASLSLAEASFVQTRFAEAASGAASAALAFDALPSTSRTGAGWMRATLLQGRAFLALGDRDAARAAFLAAAGADPGAVLDEAEYPPDVRRAFEEAQARIARPRPVRIQSEPAGAEVEVNGRLVARTPAELALPAGRCRLVLARPGSRAVEAPCSRDSSVRLEPARDDELADQLRDRLLFDRRWFTDVATLSTLGEVTGARWLVTLEPARGEELEARLFWTAETSFQPVSPARVAPGEIARLGLSVREAIAAAQAVEAHVTDSPTGVPVLEARSRDPEVASSAAFTRSEGRGYERSVLSSRGAGIWSRPLPGEGPDVEYYVEAYDSTGALLSRAGSADQPLRLRRVPPVPWYNRWYVWAAVGAVATGAGVTALVATRPGDVSITFGAEAMRARAALALGFAAVAAAAAGACREQQAELTISYGDAGCSGEHDLSCVNFLQFTVTRPGEFLTHCVKVESQLTDLCGLSGLANGSELFKLDPADEVTIAVKGLRVFPATSCDFVPECEPRVVFSGTTGSVKVSAAAGGAIDLPVKVRAECGLPEHFFPLSGKSCAEACSGPGLVVCEVMGGCLCKVVAGPDAGVPDAR